MRYNLHPAARSGWFLWNRHLRLLRNIIISIISSAVVRTLIYLILETSGSTVEVGPLWVSIVGSLPLIFIFSHETSDDICSPRSLALRRLIVISSCVITGLAVSAALFPGNITNFGTIAMFRNTLAFLGFGLISLFIFGTSWVWVVPLSAAAGSMLFSWPQYPTALHTTYGMLRSPGVLQYPDGTIDTSIPLALIIFIVSAIAYVGGFGTAQSASIRNFSFLKQHGGVGVPISNLIYRGWKRSTLSIPVCLISLVGFSFLIIEDFSSWAGSPRLLAESISDGSIIFGGLSLTAGIVAGQSRWRTGVTVWEKLSARNKWNIMVRPALYSSVSLSLPLLVIIAVSLFFNIVFLYRHNVTVEIVNNEVFSAILMVAGFFASVVVLSLVGVVAGVLKKGLWVPPLGLILGVTVMLILFSKIDDQDIDYRADMTSCTSIPNLDSRLCSSPVNAPFLESAASTVGNLYQNAPAKGYLPRSIYLVDNAVTKSDSPMAKIGLYGKRELKISDPFPSDQIAFQLGETMSKSCANVPLDASLYVAETEYRTHDDYNDVSNSELNDLQKCLNL